MQVSEKMTAHYCIAANAAYEAQAGGVRKTIETLDRRIDTLHVEEEKPINGRTQHGYRRRC
jgi:hypothetical protein